MKLLNRVSLFIDKGCHYAITFLLVNVSIVLFIQVFSRFVLNTGTFWTDELARFSIVWLVLLGVSTAVREKSLISVDILESIYPKIKKILNVLQTLILITYCVLLTNIGWGTLGLVKDQLSPNMGLPMTVLYAALPISSFIMVLHLIAHLFAKKGQGEDN